MWVNVATVELEDARRALHLTRESAMGEWSTALYLVVLSPLIVTLILIVATEFVQKRKVQ